jgi:hypothetical protein
MPSFLHSTHKQSTLSHYYTQQHCYVSLKTLYPGGIRTRVFLFLRRMWCRLRHAAKASCYFLKKFKWSNFCRVIIRDPPVFVYFPTILPMSQTGWPDEFAEAIAQNVAQPNFSVKLHAQFFTVEKGSLKIWDASKIFQNTTQSKQSPNLLKFGQSGHPGAKAPHQCQLF